jgi:hypothetical protein
VTLPSRNERVRTHLVFAFLLIQRFDEPICVARTTLFKLTNSIWETLSICSPRTSVFSVIKNFQFKEIGLFRVSPSIRVSHCYRIISRCRHRRTALNKHSPHEKVVTHAAFSFLSHTSKPTEISEGLLRKLCTKTYPSMGWSFKIKRSSCLSAWTSHSLQKN